jgi:N utilization substance protein B
MSTRRQAREWAVQLLFQVDLNKHVELDRAFASFWDSQDDAAPSSIEFTELLVSGVRASLQELDDCITGVAENWDVGRMGTLDRNVIRMAVYEMLHLMDIPPVVSINEAVDIAKRYGSPESGRFVNGILDRICEGLERPARGVGSSRG